jgi:methylglutaconyl-CoA hydratase
MLLSGQLYLAQQMKEYGLVTHVAASVEIDAKVREFATMLTTKNSTNSMKLTKDMLADFAEMTLVDSLDEAARLNAHARSSDDCKQGISAFLNKSSINW